MSASIVEARGARDKQLRAEVPDTALLLDVAAPILLGYQIKWIEDRSELKVIEKSRRTGITWAEASDNVLTASSASDAGGMNVYYISYNQDMALEYIQAVAMWARAFNMVAGEMQEGFWSDDERDADRNIKTFTVKFPKSGFRIVALSSRPANLRGKQGVVVIDEAAFCPELAELLKAAIALTIWGGGVHVISTHNRDTNAFNQLIESIRGGKQEGSVHRIEFKEAVQQGLYRRVCNRLQKPHTPQGEAEWMAKIYKLYALSFAEELDVVPSNGSGNALNRTMLLAIARAVPVHRFAAVAGLAWQPRVDRVDCAFKCIREIQASTAQLDAQHRHSIGVDVARTGDLSCFWVGAEYNLHDDCALLVELRTMPFDVQRMILFWLYRHIPRASGMGIDARGLGMQMAEEAKQEFGTHVLMVQTSEAWYRDHMPPFITAITEQCASIPLDDEVIDDHLMLEKINGVYKLKEGAVIQAPSGQRHGDSAIAHAMQKYARRNIKIADIDAQSAGARDLFDAQRTQRTSNEGFGAVVNDFNLAGFF